MATKDEAMRIALEALGTVREWEVADYDPLENAIAALHQAIEQAEKQEHDLNDVRCEYCGYMTYHREHMGCIKAAYIQAEKQEPYAYIYETNGPFGVHQSLRHKQYNGRYPDKTIPVYTAPPSKPMTGWQPIETAPKTGRELILLLTPSLWPQLAYSNTWWLSGFSVETNPTHWMPIPAIETKHGIFGSLPND